MDVQVVLELIDLGLAIEYVDLYIELLIDFVHDFDSMVPDLRQRLQKKDFDGAATFVHGVKGITANLGIDEVNRIVQSLEQAWKAADAVRIEGLTAQLEQTMQRVVAAIEKSAVFRASGPKVYAKTIDHHQVSSAMSELSAKLRQGRLDALDGVQVLTELLPHERYGAELAKLAREVRHLEYEDAQRSLSELALCMEIVL